MFRILLILALLGATLAPRPSRAETYSTCHAFITSLPATISSQGVYCLKQDLSTAVTSGFAIDVNTNNVTIDCNGYKIGGLAAGSHTRVIGIDALARVNIRVRNCNIRGFLVGVALSGSGHAVEDCVFDSNLTEGIRINGDGGLIRNNQVIATGGGDSQLMIGIRGIGEVDIQDNRVDGVVGTPGSDASTTGILLQAVSASTISHNIVRNLAPTGSSTANGISAATASKTIIDDNRVTLSSPVANSVGYACNSGNVSIRNNTSWGFATGNGSGCIDAGGNAVH